MSIITYLNNIFGEYVENLTIMHLILRALIVYVLGVLLARLNKHFFSIKTSYNFFLNIFIGAVLGTAITGPLFYEVLGMAIFIMLVNWLVAFLGYHLASLDAFINGRPIVLIEDGKMQKSGMRKCLITEHELLALLRAQEGITNLSLVEKAYFENTGQISFILKK